MFLKGNMSVDARTLHASDPDREHWRCLGGPTWIAAFAPEREVRSFRSRKISSDDPEITSCRPDGPTQDARIPGTSLGTPVRLHSRPYGPMVTFSVRREWTLASCIRRPGRTEVGTVLPRDRAVDAPSDAGRDRKDARPRESKVWLAVRERNRIRPWIVL